LSLRAVKIANPAFCPVADPADVMPRMAGELLDQSVTVLLVPSG
jgi:hypothetical protein